MGAKKLKILCETFLGEKLNWNNLPNLTTNNWPEVGSSRPIKLDVSGKRKEKMEKRENDRENSKNQKDKRTFNSK